MQLIQRLTDWLHARRNRDLTTLLRNEVVAIKINERCESIKAARCETARQIDVCYAQRNDASVAA